MVCDESESEGLSPADAFALVGHEHRVDILRSLLAACRTRDEYPTSFSTLYERTDIEVSAQFSYHLGELTGQFVRRTDDGYELRYAGWEVATSILAGTYNRRLEFGPTSIDGTCPHCGGTTLDAAYREEWLAIGCTACDVHLVRYTFPPGGLESRSLPETLRAFDRHVRSHVALARTGVCPGCFGVMEVQTASVDERVDEDHIVVCVCQRCGNRLRPQPGLFLVNDEHVVRFFHDHGRSLSGTPFWEHEFCVSGACTSVTATDPWRCVVTIPREDEQLVVSVDDTLTVRSATVESRRET